ncbi:hypothetical protein AANUM_1466 [Aggregatibacter actinomycetemcomitans NUM4039]|nr:hypothetical protein AANUM_1466 [Aggregatibacter actinomycetemcomitans NUM4039]
MFLIFISFSSYSNLYIDDNYDLILEKDKGVIKRYDIFNDVKFDLKMVILVIIPFTYLWKKKMVNIFLVQIFFLLDIMSILIL